MVRISPVGNKASNPTREKAHGYLVGIKQLEAPSLEVVGKMSDIQMELTADWAPLVDPEVGQFAGAVEWGLRRFFDVGVTTRHQSTSIARYTASQYLTLPIQFQFVAYMDPYTDVMLPCKKLHQMVTATSGISSGSMVRPISVSVMIGGFIFIKQAVIGSVSVSYSKELVVGESNRPLPSKADVDITIQASYLYLQKDIDALYRIQ